MDKADNKNNSDVDRMARRLSNAFYSAASPAAWSAGEAMLAACFAVNDAHLGAAILSIGSAIMLGRSIKFFAEGLSDPLDDEGDNDNNKPVSGPGSSPSPG